MWRRLMGRGHSWDTCAGIHPGVRCACRVKCALSCAGCMQEGGVRHFPVTKEPPLVDLGWFRPGAVCTLLPV